VIPFGNGAERVLENHDIKAHIINLEFNRHGKDHLYRAALEGIAFSFVYGMEVMKEMGMPVNTMKVGNDNLFQSAVFAETIANTLGCEIEMIDTTGAVGAAKAAGIGAGIYSSYQEAFKNTKIVHTYRAGENRKIYDRAYQKWKTVMEGILKNKH
ncbi:MAG: FGGY-family carbohydrate kinase, partial [Cyclobacteriaceae bacterium]